MKQGARPAAATAGLAPQHGRSHRPALAEALRGLQGKAVVSINDHPDIRAVFAGFDLVPLQLGYTIGGACGRDRQFGELIIKTWGDSQASLL